MLGFVRLLLSLFVVLSITNIASADSASRSQAELHVSGFKGALSDHNAASLEPLSMRRNVVPISPVNFIGIVPGEGLVKFVFAERYNRTWKVISKSNSTSTLDASSEPVILRGLATSRRGHVVPVTASWNEGKVRFTWRGRTRGVLKRSRYFTATGQFSTDGAKTLRVSSRPMTAEECGNSLHDEVDLLAPGVKTERALATTSMRNIELAVFVDETGIAKFGSGIVAEVARIVAAVDQIYRRDLNFAVELKAIVDVSGRYTATLNSTDLLREFRLDINEQSVGMPFDIALMFNNRALNPRADGSHSTNGVSYVDATCSSYNHMLVTFYSPAPIVTTAHEGGHNLGSNHDADRINGVAYIMYFQSVTDRVDTFSQDSKTQISEYTSGIGGACLAPINEQGGGGTPTPVPTAQPTVTPPPPTPTVAPPISTVTKVNIKSTRRGRKSFRITVTTLDQLRKPVEGAHIALFQPEFLDVITEGWSNRKGKTTFSLTANFRARIYAQEMANGVISKTVTLKPQKKKRNRHRRR